MLPVKAVRLVLPALATIIAATIVGLVALPAPAWAHTELESTTPAADSTVTAPIDEVTLTFGDAIRGDGISVEVVGPDGVSASAGTPTVLDTTVHQPVANLRDGAYQVHWRVLAADGDPVSGDFAFMVDLPAGSESTTGPATQSTLSTTVTQAPAPSSSNTAWWWLAVPVVLIIAVGAWFVARRRGRP